MNNNALLNNLSRTALANMTQNQQIVYTAMMMDTKMIPVFNQPQLDEAFAIGKKIKQLFDDGVYTKMSLDQEGVVSLS